MSLTIELPLIRVSVVYIVHLIVRILFFALTHPKSKMMERVSSDTESYISVGDCLADNGIAIAVIDAPGTGADDGG